MSITSNISLPILKDTPPGWLLDKAERLAAFTAAQQMEVRANTIWQIARTLSGGNQQKVVLAKWLSTKPRILILKTSQHVDIDVGYKSRGARLDELSWRQLRGNCHFDDFVRNSLKC